MVSPITGPFTRTLGLHEYTSCIGLPAGATPPVSYEKVQKWYRQRKPYSSPLPYESSIKAVTSHYSRYPPSCGDISSASWYVPSFADDAVNKAYGKLNDEIGEAALWAVNVKEMQQSMDLLTGPFGTLAKASKEIRRFQFKRAARTLGIIRPKGLVRDSKAHGNNWLKYHFGIAPLMQDIHATIDILQQDFQPKVVKARAAVHHAFRQGPYGSYSYTRDHKYVTRCLMQTEVSVSNPNLYLANKLGMLNPATFLWEIIPYSFVVDWFVNIGQILGQWTDFAGVSLKNAFTTIYQKAEAVELWYMGTTTTTYSIFVRRTLGLTKPVLKIRPWKGVSAVRGLTAVSLLLQHLR